MAINGQLHCQVAVLMSNRRESREQPAEHSKRDKLTASQADKLQKFLLLKSRGNLLQLVQELFALEITFVSFCHCRRRRLSSLQTCGQSTKTETKRT